MQNRKGIVLAGGNGSRLYPLTNSISKQLLPIYNKPMIYYSLSTLMLSGIQEILIITQSHFIPLFKNLLKDGSHLGLSISYKAQDIPAGIAEAFIIGEDFIGEDNVALILGDNIFYGSELNSQLIKASKSNDITLFACTVSNPNQFGVFKYDRKSPVSILEKPKIAPSNDAVTGLYFYDNEVCKIAKSLKKSERGELEITDLNNYYLKNKKVLINKLSRETLWLDTGTFENLQQCSQIIYSIEKNTNIMIGCIEEISLKQGWIKIENLSDLLKNYGNNEYFKYLNNLINGNH